MRWQQVYDMLRGKIPQQSLNKGERTVTCPCAVSENRQTRNAPRPPRRSPAQQLLNLAQQPTDRRVEGKDNRWPGPAWAERPRTAAREPCYAETARWHSKRGFGQAGPRRRHVAEGKTCTVLRTRR